MSTFTSLGMCAAAAAAAEEANNPMRFDSILKGVRHFLLSHVRHEMDNLTYLFRP